MLFYCSEHMQKRESNICELDTCSFLRFSLPTNTEPFHKVRRFSYSDANGVASSCSPKNDSRPQAQNRAGRQTAILRLLKPGS